jgi:hypothetical protein
MSLLLLYRNPTQHTKGPMGIMRKSGKVR